MRLPFLRPYRMFEEFDHLSDAECDRYVRDAYINAPTFTARLPLALATIACIAWYAGWPFLVALFPGIPSQIPMPSSIGGRVILLIVTGVAFTACVYFVLRDLGVYLGIRRELRRACCRKCGQSLMGLPIHLSGVDPDPAKRFVRCTECGRKWVLLDIGITPRDLVPFEQRVTRADVAKRR